MDRIKALREGYGEVERDIMRYLRRRATPATYPQIERALLSRHTGGQIAWAFGNLTGAYGHDASVTRHYELDDVAEHDTFSVIP